MVLLVVLAGLLAAAGTGGYRALHKPADTINSLTTAKVSRGPMLVSITESGEISAEQQEVITNPTRWPVIIQELAPEGSIVQEGQLIIRMQCKELDDTIVDQELKVRAAEDEYQAASNKFLVTRKTKDAAVEKAKQAVKDAADDLEKYREGEGPVKAAEAKATILLAEGSLGQAQHKLESMKKINEDPELNQPYSDKEIRDAELNVQRLELDLEKARSEERILLKYTHPRTLREKQMGVQDAQLTLETTELEAQTEIRLAEAAQDSARVRLTKQQERLKELQDDKAKLTVTAKKPGLVVYETRRRPWHHPITVAVDEKIEPSQQLMIIPNMKTLQVNTRVYEAIREQVDIGLPARVRLDARPGKVLEAELAKVAPLPDSQNPWLSPGVKQYPAVVKLKNDSDTQDLKPGMNAKVEIILAELKDVLSVPIAGVFAEGEETYCYRADEGGKHTKVKVTIGKTSETRAQILSGLAEGDSILLAPPPGVQVGRKLKEEQKDEQPRPPMPVEGETTSAPAQSARPNGPRGPEEAGATSRPSAGQAGRAAPSPGKP